MAALASRIDLIGVDHPGRVDLDVHGYGGLIYEVLCRVRVTTTLHIKGIFCSHFICCRWVLVWSARMVSWSNLILSQMQTFPHDDDIASWR